MTAKKSKCCGNHANFFMTLLLGILLGAAAGFAAKDSLTAADWATLFALGFGAAWIVFALADALRICLAVKSNPISDDLEVADRSIAAERATALAGSTPLHARLRHLLAAWGAGATGPQVTAMASAQNVRAQASLAAETVAVAAIIILSADFGPSPYLLPAGAALAALVLLIAIVRFRQTCCIAGYIEGRLLARIGNDTPAAAAADFAKAAREAASASADTLAAAQEKASARLAQAQDAIAKQLDRIAGLASTIDQTLQLQKSVDGTLKGVTAAEEFKSTLLELKRHLADSDQLLKNAARPRTLRLVENPAED
jgi:hypothetical protein